MSRIAGVRWRTADPIVYADVGELEITRNTYVVIDTEKGPELGWIAREPKVLIWS